MFYLGRLGRWWRDRRRHIFWYHDGTRWHRADPLVIGQRLESECPKYLDYLEMLGKDLNTAPIGPVRADLMRQKKECAEELVVASRKIFNLKALDDTGGLTGPECIGQITRYFLYMQELATAAEVFPSSPAAA